MRNYDRANVRVGSRLGPGAVSAQCPDYRKADMGWAIYEYTPTTPLAPRMGSCRLVPARSCVDEPIAVFRRFRITPHRGAAVAQRLWTTGCREPATLSATAGIAGRSREDSDVHRGCRGLKLKRD